MHITWGQATDTGLVRKQNEDAVFSLYVRGDGAAARPDFGVFAVARGLGGPNIGAKASQIVTQTIAEDLLNPLFKSTATANTRPNIEEALRSAFQAANIRILKEPDYGIGAAVTSAVVFGDSAYIGQVGDTGAILVIQDQVKQLTLTHRLPKLLMSEWETRKILYRAFGQSDELEVDTVSLKLIPASWLVLFSDGLLPFKDYNEPQISTEAKNLIMNADNPQQACDQLIALANERGGEDNASVIVIKVSE